ncbi:hypothetical protein [Ignicoccus hospitalis]|uniref:Uncharacterized protein n=1 Tax=Ignicoccus hospitalis (strain KIN4/I / DSM 18386 / JCM 14125) TaxID=453591 RepID=A8A8M3_IGNH4|nr:hypothetical protein [Ignicoccus hospitalis]ABU81275.1 hypothetical protein Igni_0091 [Ignicoccus hospitalis KIN4/I]HIH90957.1 hypothetical protein [Desulfurococcaceae archaeon]
MRVKSFEGFPVEAEGVEDPEMVAAVLGEIGELMKKLNIKVVKLDGEMVVGEG